MKKILILIAAVLTLSMTQDDKSQVECSLTEHVKAQLGEGVHNITEIGSLELSEDITFEDVRIIVDQAIEDWDHLILTDRHIRAGWHFGEHVNFINLISDGDLIVAIFKYNENERAVFSVWLLPNA